MTGRVLASAVIAGVLSIATGTAAGQPANPCAGKNPCAAKPANPCAAKNPCGAKSPSAAPRDLAAGKSGPQSNFSATGASPMRDLPVDRTGQIILAQ